MNEIFISYRRDDAEGQAGRLYDDLSAEFGDHSVFMDVTAINPGLDFRKAVDQGLSSCKAFLVVIGKNWLTAADSSGRRRLDDPADFVRLEVAEALKRENIPVVPVLVQGALMPRVDDLPDDLKNLAYRNAVEVSHARWSSDMSLLITALRNHVAVTAVSSRENESQLPSSRPESRRYRSWFLFVSIPLFLAISGFYILRRLYLPAHPSGPPVKEVITGQVSHPPDLSGVWRQTNPQTNVEKPDPPMRLRITQQDSMVAVYLTYGTSFPGEAIGKARIEKDRATWTLKGGCGGSSTFVVYLSGDVLFYEVTDTFPVPCGGHPAGVEHRPVAEFRRIQGVTG